MTPEKEAILICYYIGISKQFLLSFAG